MDKQSTERIFPTPLASPNTDPSQFFELGRLVAQLEEEQTARMKALLEVSSSMNATLDETELLPFMMDKLIELMRADHGYLVLLRTSNELIDGAPDLVHLDVKVSVSRSPGNSGKSSPPSQTLIRHVIDTREPMRWDDALSDESIRESKSAHELGLRSVMAVPLLTRGRLIGVLSVENRGKFAQFNNEHLDFLQIFGNQAAVAIENARLYRSLRDAQAQLFKAHKALRLEMEESQMALRSERQRLETLESEVRHLDKMAALGTMTSAIAHELNNPLTGALGFAQLLSMSPNLTERQRQMVTNIASEMGRCAEITRNLLRFSRKSRGELSPIDLNRLVSEAVDLRRYQFEVSDTVIHEHYDRNIGVVMADHFQLKGVFLNILNNAFDAIHELRPSGSIEVITRLLEDGRAEIAFQDDGGGVQEPDKIFDPFYTTKEVGKGTGLGMSVAFGVVRSHGGTIQVANEAGGARVTVTLPSDPGASTSAHTVAPALPGPTAAAGSVLVVDDEAVIRELCQALLEGEGYQVDLANDGVSAMKLLESNPYDVIITDIRMPGKISGVDLYRWIQVHQPQRSPYVIFITGDLMTRDLREVLGEVGNRLIPKPFEVSTLLETVRTTRLGQPNHPPTIVE